MPRDGMPAPVTRREKLRTHRLLAAHVRCAREGTSFGATQVSSSPGARLYDAASRMNVR
jgi:hypothetical protein